MEPHALMLAAAMITRPPPGPGDLLDCGGEGVVAHPVIPNLITSTASERAPKRRIPPACPPCCRDIPLASSVTPRKARPRVSPIRGTRRTRIGVSSTKEVEIHPSGHRWVGYLVMNTIA